MDNFINALNKSNRRPNSVAVIGAFFGDEGKGRITDEIADFFLNKRRFEKIILYRDNGGANAGHTISCNGKKISLHQIGSGILHKGCQVVLGKGMVIHPVDLLDEISEIKKVFDFRKLPAQLLIDQMAVLSLDTHRAFEVVLKHPSNESLGSSASTDRGISPAYADILFRFPLRVRDLFTENWEGVFSEHYDRYKLWIKGMGADIEDVTIQRFMGKKTKVGSKAEFLNNLLVAKQSLKPFVFDVYDLIKDNWFSDTPFIFEKAQAIGLDHRWGVYPDISASNCCLDGIAFSTEGLVQIRDISARLGVIKSTYSSSVGKRTVPTIMEKENADRIRESANEFGSTTGRPRDILYLDLVMLKYYCKVSEIEELVFTHMDVVFDKPIKVCVEYKIDGKKAEYRPDQEHLKNIEPVYRYFKPWEADKFKQITSFDRLPHPAKDFISFVCSYTETKPVILTYGADRNKTIII